MSLSFTSRSGHVAVSPLSTVPSTMLKFLHDTDQISMSACKFATSIDGTFLAISYKSQYVLLRTAETSPLAKSMLASASSLVSVGSDAAAADERITALCCLALYTTARSRGAQAVCVAVGYDTGHLRIFSQHGHLLTTHRLHAAALLGIRVRPAIGSLGAEEINLTFADGHFVSIDGQSMYLALRLCVDANADAEEAPAFSYKKYHFGMPLSDALGYGPPANHEPLASLAKAHSSLAMPNATAQFLVAPRRPGAALGVFMTSADARPAFSAVDIAGRVAARVTGAVLSLAKAYLWRDAEQPDPSDTATAVPCTFWVQDAPRQVLEIIVAPPQYQLAACRDSLGRIVVMDLDAAEAVQMLKGVRGSQCAWAETNGRLFIVVYVTRRGILEVFECGTWSSIGTASIGLGWTLVQAPTHPVGASLAAAGAPTHPAQCLLVSSTGTISRVDILL